MDDTVEAGPSFEFVDFKSIGRAIPLFHPIYKTSFRDNDDGKGSIIGPRSILRIRVEREEVPWCDICLESKAQHL